MNNKPSDGSVFEITLRWKTLFSLLAFCALIFSLFIIRDFLLLLLLAILIAVTLAPIQAYMQRLGLGRRLTLIIISATVVGLFACFFLFVVPPVVTELGNLTASLPMLQENILHNAPRLMGIRNAMQTFFNTPIDVSKFLTGLLSVAQVVMSGITSMFIVIVFSLYLLSDGPRAYRWLLPYFSNKNQKKISSTVEELLKVVIAYISGQVITSVVAAVFTLALLISLSVPAALVLAVAAGIFDILPIVGFFVFIVPASLLALTVSPATAVIVLIAYTGYHFFENYILVPKIYGARLRLSGLVVLGGVLFGSAVAGIPGAIAILPILASYPIVERIWLERQVGSAAVEEHTSEAKSFEV